MCPLVVRYINNKKQANKQTKKTGISFLLLLVYVYKYYQYNSAEKKTIQKHMKQEEFEDTKGAIRICISKKE